MKIQSFHIFLLLLCCNSFSLHAQYGKQKKADALFSKFSFVKAAETYKEMLENKYNTVYAERKLADCYYMLRDPENAATYYEKVVQQKDIPIEYYYNYAVVLRGLGNYDESKIWAKKYKKEGGGAKMVRELKKDIPTYANAQPRYTIEESNFNTPYSDFGAYQYGNLLYFVSPKKEIGSSQRIYGWNEQPFLDMYVINLADSIPSAKAVDGDINTKFHEGPISVTKNGKTMYFSRNNYYENSNKKDKKGVNHLQIYKAEYVAGKWTHIKDLPFNNKNYSVSHPALSPDEKTLYFASDMPGGYGKSDLYKVAINEDGSYGVPENLGGTINTEGDELFPFVNEEDNLFFSSDGHLGFGLLDIFGTVKGIDGNTVEVVNLGKPINSKRDDFSFFMAPDGISGYFASNRKDHVGDDNIYQFETILPLMLKGVVSDSINGKPIAHAEVQLKNEEGDAIALLTTDNNGYYETNIDRDTDYSITAHHPKYNEKTKEFTSKNIPKNITEMVVNIALAPVTDLKVLADLNTIYFDFDKYNIRPDAANELNKIIALLLDEYPEMVIKIASHTDSRGSFSYNDKLSLDRANATYEYLITNGLSPERVVAHNGYGERRLTNGCSDGVVCEEPEHQKNRRTDFIILKMN